MKTRVLLAAVVLTFASVTWGQIVPVQVGDIMAGTCDSWQNDTELGATEVTDASGNLINEFDAFPGMNVCVIGMATDVNGYTFVQTDLAGLFEFDQFGHSVNPGFSREAGLQQNGLPRLRTIVHDQRGNYYMADSQAYIDRAGGPDGEAGYAVPGGAWRFDLLPDQHTVAYVSVADSHVYTYDLANGTAALVLSGTYASVVALPDSSLLALNTAGIVSHYDLSGHLLKAYTLPHTVTNAAADPDGVSFRALDVAPVDGFGNVYRVNVATGELLSTANISPGVSNGRFYSGSLQVYGSGLAVPATLTKALRFGNSKKPIPVGTVKVKTIAVKNLGNTVLVVSNVALRSADGGNEFFVTKSTCGVGVRPGTHCNIWIAFSATAPGTFSGSATVWANFASGTQQSTSLVAVAR